MTDDNLQLAPEEARIATILRSMTVADLEFESPPTSLWDDINAAVLADGMPSERGEIAGESDIADVVDITSRFRRGSAFFAAAAAAVVVVIGAVVVSANSSDDSAEVVGEAELIWTPDDPAFVAEGAEVTVNASFLADDESASVRIDDGTLPTRADEDLELWLIGVDGDGALTIQTLGVIDDASGTYSVPATFDADAFETVLVDISFEPRDGDETHSGASIVRGALTDV